MPRDTATARIAPGGSTTTGSAIRVEGVTKVYPSDSGPVAALDRIDLDIREGEFVSLLGPSGCGKSTLLHIVAGLTGASSGRVDIGGAPARADRTDVSIMLQRPVLFPWKNVLENVMLPAKIQGRSQTDARQAAMLFLELTGLADFAGKQVWELSGGMKQRVSLARALATDPPVLLMDEPFSALDEFTRERLNVELARLHDEHGRTTLFVTHNIAEAVFLSDRIVTMRPRPGGVVDVIDIAMPRPRTAQQSTSAAATDLALKVRESISAYL
jgi:NitT/TauT family transport system ATP-binding protein